MKIKPISSSSIQYVLIQKDSGVQNMIKYHQNASNNIFNILPHFPRDLMQFHNQDLFFKTSMIMNEINPGLNLLTFTDEQLNSLINPIIGYTKILNLENRPVVYFIDLKSNISLIKKTIKDSGQKNWYYTFCGQSKQQVTIFEKKRFFKNPIDLIKNLKRDFELIKSTLSEITEGSKDLEFNLDESYNNNELHDFNPITSNYFTSLQINNEYWKLNYPKSIPNPKNNVRNDILLKSVIQIDKRHLKLNEKRSLSHKLPIIIISFPFYNPSLNSFFTKNAKTKTEKIYSKVFSIEQSTDYLNYFEAINDEEVVLAEVALKEFLKPKLKLLDGIAFLQSSFTFSPTLRFPIIGKSIYKELSFFNPKNNFFSTEKSKKNKLLSIQKFGAKLTELTISEKTKKYLSNRNGQTLAISDLPIEWLCIDSIPISFTHDICRIQESNYQGTLNNYSANNRIDFVVTENSLKKTLVILSDDVSNIANHEFKDSYRLVEERGKSLGFNYAYCKSIVQISDAVKKYNPDILIFDCHGNIDVENETSYLVINGERLYGNEIVEYNISAPIVFLSCCNSNPNYGYINKIHDAFFQAGALSVTGTFLPISIKRGTIYYLRMLNLLNQEFSKRLHTNWLSFISQVIRSSIMHEAYIKANRKLTFEEEKNLSKLILDTHIFSKRRKIFTSLTNEGIKLSKNLTFNIKDTECEFLMYSHYGRPDLIRML
jgi:hypothetical protein